MADPDGNGKMDVEPQEQIEGPERPPYVGMLISLRTGMTYLLRMPEEAMPQLVAGWNNARHANGVLTIDAGGEGTYDFAAIDIIFMKRVGEHEIAQINEANAQNAQRARILAGLR